MELLLAREPTVDGCTFGHLFIDGRLFGFTLEDAVRDGSKLAHETAIPAGRYPVTITPSQRFHRLLPLVEQVPGFTGIRIHPGNTTADTSGCILVGLARTNTALESSRAAIDVLQPLIANALAKGEAVTLTVQNHPVSEAGRA